MSNNFQQPNKNIQTANNDANKKDEVSIFKKNDQFNSFDWLIINKLIHFK